MSGWDGAGSYEQRPGILARTYMSDYEKQAIRRERWIRFACKGVVVVCVGIWIGLAMWMG